MTSGSFSWATRNGNEHHLVDADGEIHGTAYESHRDGTAQYGQRVFIDVQAARRAIEKDWLRKGKPE